MTTSEEFAFATLLQRWNQHQDLRGSGTPIADLANSRSDLDAARLAIAQTRHRHAA